MLVFENQKVRDFWKGQMLLVKDCYNFISKIAFDEKTPLGLKAFHKRMYKAAREAFPELPSQMCIKIYKQVLANYKTVKDQEEKEKREKEREKNRKKKGKKNEQSTGPVVEVADSVQEEENEEFLTEPIKMKNPCVGLDKRLYSGMTQRSIKLSSGDFGKRSQVDFVLYPKFVEMASQYRMCDPNLKYDEKKDDFFLCVPFLTIAPTPLPEEYMGIDLGIKRAATLSDGSAYSDKEYLSRRRRIRHNKSVFRKHKRKSHSARAKLKKNSRRETNISDNQSHLLANWIISHDATVFVMEDLSRIKRTTSKTKKGFKRKRHNNMMSQVAFYKLKQILTYKAPLLGKRVETVSPHDTSQMDCRSQSIEGCRRKGCRFYTADGMVFDADWNAAINICNRKHPTPFRLPLDGRLNFVGRRRQHANRGSGQPDLQAAASSARR